MKRRCSRLLAAALAFALSAQSTGAASLPIALMTPRAAFPPPSARFAAFPAPRPAPAAASKAPARASWLESARIVSDFVLERIQQELNPAPADESYSEPIAPAVAGAIPPEIAPADGAVITPLSPGVNSPSDRMMVVMEAGRSVAAVLDGREQDFSAAPPAVSGPAPVLAPFREPWQEQNGLRARVSYIRSHGAITLDSDGFTAAFADGTIRHAPNTILPKKMKRNFPIYYHGEEVTIELTVENKTGRTLNDVRLEAVQETFRAVGTEGVRLAPAAEVKVAKSLAPGQRKTVRWRARLEGPAHAAVNLEQTHVRVTSDGRSAPLLDAPQAGVIDPPGPGWH
jgi:hypothetical protein